MLELPNTGNSTLERAAKIEAELQLLHTQPEFFIKRDVYMRWIQDGKDFGVYHGVVKNVDNDKLGGAQLWGILWDDNTTTDFTITDMQKFCIQHIDGSKIAPPVLNNTSKMHSNQGESSSKATSSTEPNATMPDSNADDDTDIEPATMEAVRKRLDNLGVEYFKPKKSMSFTEICKACSIPHAQRHLYYEWLAQEHGYGAIPPAQDKDLPWFQFENPIGILGITSEEFILGSNFLGSKSKIVFVTCLESQCETVLTQFSFHFRYDKNFGKSRKARTRSYHQLTRLSNQNKL